MTTLLGFMVGGILLSIPPHILWSVMLGAVLR